jgi:tRNA G18 (ribose-2'-O)-methylase SpoU
MNELCGFAIHRGILACARRRPVEDVHAVIADATLVCCILGISNHDNVGGIFRSARAFGADAILVDNASCDPLYRKAIRVSSGTTLTLPFARGSQSDLLNALTLKGFDLVALAPKATTALAARGSYATGKAALLLGAEGPGLDPEVLRNCRGFRIPMVPTFDSINVAAAASVALYELRRGAANLL